MIPKMKAARRGRKPATDPKVQIPLFIEQSLLKRAGGKENARAIIYNFLTQKFKP